MNSIKYNSVKPILFLILTLFVGFFIGFITHKYIANQKMMEIMSLKTEQGFTSKYLKLIDPSESQKTEIENLLKEYAQKNSKLVAAFTDSLNNLNADLKDRLDPKLNKNQKLRIQKTIPNSNTNRLFHNKKRNIIIEEFKKDSVSMLLLDTLQKRRDILRKERVKKKMDSLIVERSLLLKRELNLNQTQFVAVDKLNIEYTNYFHILKKDTILSMDEKKLKIKQLRRELSQKMRQILTNEQFEIFKKLAKEEYSGIK